MKIFALTLAVFATVTAALSSKHLPPHQSLGGLFVGSGAASVGHAAVVQPFRQYVSPAASTSHGVSVGHSGGFPSGGSGCASSSVGGFGAGSSSHGVAVQPSRQYLRPAVSTTHAVSTGFSSGGSSFGGQSGGFSSGGSFGGFDAASSGHAVADKPSRRYLAPAASTAHVVSAGFSSGGSSFGGHSGGFSSGGPSVGGFATPSLSQAFAVSTSHAVSTGLSGGHSAGTKYGTNGGYEYRNHHFA